MNLPSNDIALLIGHPERLNRDTLYTLRAVVAHYPWFETARLLLLDNLYLLHDPDFASELRASVLYIHDRRTLCHLVSAYSQMTADALAADRVAAEPEPTVDRTMSLIDAFLSTLPEMPQTLIPDTPLSTDYMAVMTQKSTDVAVAATEQMLSPDSSMPSCAAGNVESNLSNSEDEVTQSGSENDNGEPMNSEFFTETLARIYIRQKKYDRALEIIRSLYLNYPEKSRYFADQIRYLEILIENNNLKNK